MKKKLPSSMIWCAAKAGGDNAGVLVGIHTRKVYGVWRRVRNECYIAFDKRNNWIGEYKNARSARNAIESEWRKRDKP